MGHQWQFANNDGRWESYDDESCVEVEKAYQAWTKHRGEEIT